MEHVVWSMEHLLWPVGAQKMFNGPQNVFNGAWNMCFGPQNMIYRHRTCSMDPALVLRRPQTRESFHCKLLDTLRGEFVSRIIWTIEHVLWIVDYVLWTIFFMVHRTCSMVYVERVLWSTEFILWTIEHALHTRARTHAQAQTPHLREAHLHAVLKVKTGRSVAKPT